MCCQGLGPGSSGCTDPAQLHRSGVRRRGVGALARWMSLTSISFLLVLEYQGSIKMISACQGRTACTSVRNLTRLLCLLVVVSTSSEKPRFLTPSTLKRHAITGSYSGRRAHFSRASLSLPWHILNFIIKSLKTHKLSFNAQAKRSKVMVISKQTKLYNGDLSRSLFA